MTRPTCRGDIDEEGLGGRTLLVSGEGVHGDRVGGEGTQPLQTGAHRVVLGVLPLRGNKQ